jgi:hypothetical protein
MAAAQSVNRPSLETSVILTEVASVMASASPRSRSSLSRPAATQRCVGVSDLGRPWTSGRDHG